jgi:hypothetical protein
MTMDAEVKAGNDLRLKHFWAKVEDLEMKRDIARRDDERAYQLSLAEFNRRNEIERLENGG